MIAVASKVKLQAQHSWLEYQSDADRSRLFDILFEFVESVAATSVLPCWKAMVEKLFHDVCCLGRRWLLQWRAGQLKRPPY